jgi:isopenicillin-N N-acyltransferase-like protein
MSKRTIRQFKVSGSWFDMGREVGRHVAGDIAAFNNRYFSDPFNFIRFGSMENVTRYVRQVGRALKEYSDHAHDYLAGMATGADLPMEQVLMQAVLPELTHISSTNDWPSGGCTACCVKSAATSGTGAILGQCWDFNVELPDWYVVELMPPVNEPTMMIVGMGAFCCCCGVNSFGLGVTFTASGHLPNVPPRVGVPVVGVFIEALGAEDYYPAMDLLVAPKRAGAVNMLLSDGYDKSVLIEVAGGQVELTEEEPVLVCANHFQHPKIVERTKQNLTPSDRGGGEFAKSSVFREKRLKQLLDEAETIDADFVKQCLKDHENFPLSICVHEEETILHFRTQGAMIIEPAAKVIEFCPGQPCCGEYTRFVLE